MLWTITKACIEWKVHNNVLKKGLVMNGLTIEKNKRYTTLEISGAIYGDLERERTLETRERRKALEMENAQADGTLVTMAEVERLYTEALLPVRQRLTALPAEACTRVNPTDPQGARQALEVWVNEALQMIRQALPKAKKK